MLSRPMLKAWALALVALLATAVPAIATAAPAPSAAEPRADDATRVPAAVWAARQDAFLDAATSHPFDPGDAESVMAYAERARRDPSATTDLHAATTTTFKALLDPHADSDFTISTLLTLYVNDSSRLDPGLARAIRQRILGFKYWWTEPQPRGTIDPDYYWTENHQIIFLADEYLAGQTFPDALFTNSGMTGRQHMAHALPLIRRWVSLRSRYGFSEFLANPYTAMTFEGVLSLADLATDPAVAELASSVLDLQLVEVASHLQDVVLGSAKGRTYTGDLFDPHGGVTPALIALVFGSGAPPTGSGPATALAIAHRYRPPTVALAIAASPTVGIVRQHQGIPLDPLAPVTDHPVAPDGLTFDGNDGLMVWWAMGAQLAWQMAPQSAAAIAKYDLWNTPNFQVAGANALQGIVAGKTPAQLRTLARSLAVWLNPGLLPAVDTYTWRSPQAELSTAQDWRAGQRTESALISTATLDGGTSVFVNLPKGVGPHGPEGDSSGGYWSGDGAAPRAAQHGDTEISIYAPQYEATSVSGPNGYQPFTHASFPTQRFDQVVRRGGWTFGRKDDGYVALWSWRPTHWAPVDPHVPQPGGLTKPYELVAAGGADDVWITRVGRAADQHGGADPFAAFMASVLSRTPRVRPMAGSRACAAGSPSVLASCAHHVGDGFLVSYAPVGHAALSFGWTPAAARQPALVANGKVVALHDPAHRWSTPWATAGRDGRYHVSVGADRLDIDLPTP